MTLLILISSISFLVLITMIFLKLFNCGFKKDSVCSNYLDGVNLFLTKTVSSVKDKVKQYGNGSIIFKYLGRFFFYIGVKLSRKVLFLIRKVKSKLSRYLKKVSLKEKNKIVSEYLRSVSDYKEEKR
ncbi:MAG: hypothetical protein U9P50_01650 [Patescibacteria group bacterium]|nr:hypothetical protein [Patescibacteria group bacterium]